MTVGHSVFPAVLRFHDVLRFPGTAAFGHPLIDDAHFKAQISPNSDGPQLASSHQSANRGRIDVQIVGDLTQCEHPCRHTLASLASS